MHQGRWIVSIYDQQATYKEDMSCCIYKATL
jgi:hypothetical protein